MTQLGSWKAGEESWLIQHVHVRQRRCMGATLFVHMTPQPPTSAHPLEQLHWDLKFIEGPCQLVELADAIGHRFSARNKVNSFALSQGLALRAAH